MLFNLTPAAQSQLHTASLTGSEDALTDSSVSVTPRGAALLPLRAQSALMRAQRETRRLC